MKKHRPIDTNYLEPTDLCAVPRWVAYKKQLDSLNYEDFIQQAYSDKKGILLDVRTKEEFDLGSLKGAINFNYLSTTLADEIDHLDDSKHYYIFCRTGRRSLRVCMLLKNSGFKVINLEDGLSIKI